MKQNRSFKDYIPETPQKVDTIVHPLYEDEAVVQELMELNEDVNLKYALIEEKLRDEITMVISEEYEHKFNTLKITLQEQLMEKTVNHLQENQKMVMTMSEALLDMTSKLCEKIDILQSNLNITIPTPIVQVTLPERNTIKKVHRDNNGNITHVSEETCDNGMNNFNVGDKE